MINNEAALEGSHFQMRDIYQYGQVADSLFDYGDIWAMARKNAP